MRVGWIFIGAIIIVWGLLPIFQSKKEKEIGPAATEMFIRNWLTNDNGTLATYIQDNLSEDEDLVKGREALSESLGLWMEISVENNNREEFEQSFEVLKKYFLEEDGFVNWKLNEDGESLVYANALVDDLRLCLALFQASEKWNDHRYHDIAEKISEYLLGNNVYKNTLTDYYVKNRGDHSKYITLSYIEPESFMYLSKRNLIEHSLYKNMLNILKEAPVDQYYYPKAYDVDKKLYVYDDNINLIDQSLVVYYRAKVGYSTDEFRQFIKREFDNNGKVYGRYDRQSGRPIVTYESPSIYGWLILYHLEIGEKEMANSLYRRMIQFKSTNEKYYGGYSVYDGDTHIFENLVPLLAELKINSSF